MALLINGVGAGSGGASALGDLSDIGTMGEPIGQADNLTEVVTAMGGALAVRTAISAAQAGAPPTVLSDAMDGTGFDDLTTSGSATFAWSGGKGTGTCPLGSAASCGVEASGYLDSGEWYDLAIRVDVTAGDASSLTRLVLTAGQSAAANVSVILWTDGTVEWGSYGGGSFASLGTTAGPDSGQRTGGQLWLRLTRTPTGVAFSWGVGSAGALPTEWTAVGVSSASSVLARAGGTYVSIVVLTTSSLAFTADILAIKSSLPGGF